MSFVLPLTCSADHPRHSAFLMFQRFLPYFYGGQDVLFSFPGKILPIVQDAYRLFSNSVGEIGYVVGELVDRLVALTLQFFAKSDDFPAGIPAGMRCEHQS